MYNIFYLDEVENDINQAKQWYAEQQNDLDVRIAHTKVFPYNVHFYIDNKKTITKNFVIVFFHRDR